MIDGVRLPHLERGLYEALSDVADVVSWARGHAPRDVGSLLSLRLLAPPEGTPLGGGEAKPQAASALVTVATATAGVRSVLRLDGYRHAYDVQAGDSVTDVRDAHLAQLVALEAGRVTAVAVGADQISITPLEITALVSLEVAGELAAEVTHDFGALTVSRHQEVALVELQAFGRGAHLAASAAAVLGRALRRLVDRTVELAEWGIAAMLWTDPQDISAIAGGSWETRATSTVTVNCRSTYVLPVQRLYGVTEIFAEAP